MEIHGNEAKASEDERPGSGPPGPSVAPPPFFTQLLCDSTRFSLLKNTGKRVQAKDENAGR